MRPTAKGLRERIRTTIAPDVMAALVRVAEDEDLPVARVLDKLVREAMATRERQAERDAELPRDAGQP